MVTSLSNWSCLQCNENSPPLILCCAETLSEFHLYSRLLLLSMCDIKSTNYIKIRFSEVLQSQVYLLARSFQRSIHRLLWGEGWFRLSLFIRYSDTPCSVSSRGTLYIEETSWMENTYNVKYHCIRRRKQIWHSKTARSWIHNENMKYDLNWYLSLITLFTWQNLNVQHEILNFTMCKTKSFIRK